MFLNQLNQEQLVKLANLKAQQIGLGEIENPFVSRRLGNEITQIWFDIKGQPYQLDVYSPVAYMISRRDIVKDFGYHYTSESNLAEIIN